MTYLGSVKRVYTHSGGVRRVEFHYTGDIDPISGRFVLRRCVGKSFLDKSPKTDAELVLARPVRSA